MSTPSAWNPDQYHRFQAERRQPFDDLLAMVQPISGGRAIDLGCGPGELTKELHEGIGAKSTIGLDNSETMLARAEQYAGKGLTFKLGTILRFAPRTKFDVVFSNAALQWVPDHDRLFETVAAGVAAGGQLAVQMPDNHDHTSHVTADELAASEPFRTELDGYVRQVPVMPVEWYAAKLDSLGFKEQKVLLRVYTHYLPSRAEVVEWVKGTYLTDYQVRMSAESFANYLERYRELLMPRLSDAQPFFYAYKRILLWGRKS